MTNWTKVEDVTTSYTEVEPGGGIYDSAGIGYDSSEYRYDYYGKVEDSEERYIPFGVGLKIATEAFDWLLTEGTRIRLVHSKTDYDEVGDVSTVWTEVGDA